MKSLGLSKALISSTNVQTLRSQLALIHVRCTLITAVVARGELRRSVRLFGVGVPVFRLRNGGGVHARCRVKCVSSLAASFVSGGEGGAVGGGFGEGGGGGGDGEVKGAPVGVGVDAFSYDVIILDV
ncbi:hypothetical protein Tco_1272064 [Tanacetum coccineum]